MTVKELIEKLSEKDPEANVFWPMRQSHGIANQADPILTLIDAVAEGCGGGGEDDPQRWVRRSFMTIREFNTWLDYDAETSQRIKDKYRMKAVILC